MRTFLAFKASASALLPTLPSRTLFLAFSIRDGQNGSRTLPRERNPTFASTRADTPFKISKNVEGFVLSRNGIVFDSDESVLGASEVDRALYSEGRGRDVEGREDDKGLLEEALAGVRADDDERSVVVRSENPGI